MRCWTSRVRGGKRAGRRRSWTPQPSVRERGRADAPDPVDRGKKGGKIHVRSDAAGLPLVVAVSAANDHGSHALKPLLAALPAIRSHRGPSRRRPVKMRADKGYPSAEHRAWLRRRGTMPRIARPGIESGERLDRHRWVIDGHRPGRSATGAYHPLRTPRPPVQRLPRPRRRHHLLEEAHHMRHARSLGSGRFLRRRAAHRNAR
ncbi:transposase [Spirillospora sp. NPDC000708]